MTARERWKKFYRAMRVMRRESMKACTDVMIFGTGIVCVPSNGDDPYHVPLSELPQKLPPCTIKIVSPRGWMGDRSGTPYGPHD